MKTSQKPILIVTHTSVYVCVCYLMAGILIVFGFFVHEERSSNKHIDLHGTGVYTQVQVLFSPKVYKW